MGILARFVFWKNSRDVQDACRLGPSSAGPSRAESRLPLRLLPRWLLPLDGREPAAT